jgi:hypothetical protein
MHATPDSSPHAAPRARHSRAQPSNGFNMPVVVSWWTQNAWLKPPAGPSSRAANSASLGRSVHGRRHTSTGTPKATAICPARSP